jgi:GMP synthase (glutamine-hydrolysing)
MTLTWTACPVSSWAAGPGCVSDAQDKKSPEENKIEQAVFSLMPEITRRDVPFLGCCYGIGVLAHHLGAPGHQGTLWQ